MPAGAPGEPRILVVEPDPDDAATIVAMLGELGHAQASISVASTLSEASRRLGEAVFAVVLLDLALPDSAGTDGVDTLMQQNPDTPLVVLSGVNDDALALRCIERGAQDYLPKVDIEARALGRVIGSARARVRERVQRHRADALQRRLASIVEVSNDAIIGVSVNGTVLSWNRGAELMFGYSAAEAIDRPIAELAKPLNEEQAEAQRRRVAQIATGRRVPPCEVEMLDRHGRMIVASTAYSTIRDEDGAISSAGIFRDVTAIHERDLELRRLLAERAVRERELSALTSRLHTMREDECARISREVHDGLGQLLTSLRLDLGWIARRLLEGAAPDLIVGKVREAESLVDDTVRTVQRIAVELRPSALDLLGLAAAIPDELRRFEQRSGIVTDFDSALTTAPGEAAATAMFRILQELLVNIARHARASALHVALGEHDDHWVLSVRDNGVGLRHDTAPPLSLGLLGMRERATAVGGTFRLVNHPDGGAVATVVVPRTPP